MLDEKHGLARGAPAARNLSRAISANFSHLVCVTCCRGGNAGLQRCALWLQRPWQRTALWQGPAYQAALREGWAAAAYDTLRHVAKRGCDSWQTAPAAHREASTGARAGAGRIRSASHIRPAQRAYAPRHHGPAAPRAARESGARRARSASGDQVCALARASLACAPPQQSLRAYARARAVPPLRLAVLRMHELRGHCAG